MGQALIITGVLLILVGVLVTFGIRLPGDIYVRGKNTTFYFPVVTCIVISVILSLISWLFRR